MPPQQSEPRDSVRFSGEVDADDAESESYNVPNDATIEGLDVRIYRGAELDLHVTPWVNPPGGRDEKEPLVTFLGKQYIDGDGDHWDFPVSRSVAEDAEIGVDVKNVSSGDNGYTLDYAVDVSLDHEGGALRFGGLVDRLRGALGGLI